MNCPLCEYSHNKLLSLSTHWRKRHHSTSKDLYVQLFCDGVEPTCKCGCGEEVKFLTIKEGFSQYKQGHIARIVNNWGHNAEALKKSQNIRSEMHKRGEIPIWNKGQTKETDERIRTYGETQSRNHTPEMRKKKSVQMKQHRADGTIQDLCGKDHSRWRGGVSRLHELVRSYLARTWSRQLMTRDKFTCQRCGKQSDLCVHHDVERFATILQKAMDHFQHEDATTLSFDQKQELTLWVVDYHLDNDVSGITLCTDCHKIEHQ